MHFRVLDLATGVDEEVGPTGARFGEGHGMYSPDGKLIAYRGFGGTRPSSCSWCLLTGVPSHVR